MPRNVVFVAPFPTDITMRFVRAAARLPDVRLLGVVPALLQAIDHCLEAGGVAIRAVVDAFLHSLAFVFSSSPAHWRPSFGIRASNSILQARGLRKGMG